MSDKPMSSERAIIVLNNLNTDGRIEVDRDELRAAIAAAKEALQDRINREKAFKAKLLGEWR